jgi:pimeloyl-ACP methyl ester carboxylesterase
MSGPSEFTVIGSLKTWSVIDELHKINVPCLVLNGEFDEGRDSCVYPYFEKIKQVKWYTFSGASHCSNLDVPDKYVSALFMQWVRVTGRR